MTLPVEKYPLSIDQYFNTLKTKKSIVLHHTVSSFNAKSVINYWNQTADKVGTVFVVGGSDPSGKNLLEDGKIYQCYSDVRNWAWHLGAVKNVTSAHRTRLNEESIGIEICSWGPVTLIHGEFYDAYDQGKKQRKVLASNVQTLDTPFRGFKHFYKYSDAQIESTRKLLRELSESYGIPISKNWDRSSFELDQRAIAGEPGLWSHTNYRADKSDIFPQTEMIQMLNSL